MVFLYLISFLWAGVYANILVSSRDYKDPDVVIQGHTNFLWQKGKMQSEDINYSSHKTFWIWTSDKIRDVTIHLESLDTSKLLVEPYYSAQSENNKLNDVKITINEVNLEAFTMLFTCLIQGPTLVNVTISDIETSASFDFEKNCTIGIRDDLTIKLGNDIVVEHGKVQPDWILPLNVLHGDVDIQISIEKGVQILKPIQYEGSGIKIRGPGVTGAFLTTEPITWKLLNECKESGIVKIKFEIPYYDSLTLAWQHDCFNLTDPNTNIILTIGTAALASDIASDGLVNLEYQHGKLVDTDIYVSSFYITSSQDIEIPSPIITANKQILYPKFDLLSNKLSSVPECFRLNYRCIDDGASEVKITIPLGTSHLEFTLIKLCKRPQVTVERGSATSNSLFLGIGCLVCLTTLGIMLYSRNKAKIESGNSV